PTTRRARPGREPRQRGRGDHAEEKPVGFEFHFARYPPKSLVEATPRALQVLPVSPPPMKKNPKDRPPANLRDGAKCKVTGGTHAGKAGTVSDIKLSATGFTTITVTQANGDRFKTLARNVVVG